MTEFQDFMKKVSEKKELKEKFKALLADEKTENKLETIISFAKQCGVEVTAEEIQKAFRAIGTEGDELSDEQMLEAVGGVTSGSCPRVCFIFEGWFTSRYQVRNGIIKGLREAGVPGEVIQTVPRFLEFRWGSIRIEVTWESGWKEVRCTKI